MSKNSSNSHKNVTFNEEAAQEITAQLMDAYNEGTIDQKYKNEKKKNK